MKFRLKWLANFTTFSICSIVLYGCSSANSTIIYKTKLHIYECKNEKLIYSISDSTKIIIYPGPTQDQTILNLFENGILTVRILTSAYKNENNWYEFEAIQPEIVKTSSDSCSSDTDDKTVIVQFSSSKIDADGSILHTFEYLSGIDSGLHCFELKQINQDRFAIRFKGFIL